MGHCLLGDTVDNKVKAKIWVGCLIPLPSLLHTSNAPDNECYQITSTGRKRFTFRKSSVSHDLSYDDWCRPFYILMAIVAVKSSAEVLSYMLSHKADVWYLHEKLLTTDTWFTYDLKFHKAVVAPDINVEWGS